MELKYIPVAERSRTWLIDIDGVVFLQADRWPEIEISDPVAALLPGVKKKLAEWHMRGDRIILMTARPWTYRQTTEWQLKKAGLMYHELLMGLPTGQRILINDRKNEEDTPMAVAVNLKRDEGMESVDL